MDYGNPVWIGPLFTPTGFADEGRGFVRHLRRHGVPLSARMTDQGESAYLPQLASDFPDQVLELDAAVKHRGSGPITAIVHAPAAAPPPPPPGVAYAVCRTMWETDGLHESQVEILNLYDEIWVPSTFNRASFAKAGVRAPLEVVPGGVDATLFRPGVRPLQIARREGTVFLAIFEWSHRKAPDVLLKAWADAFDPADPVTLLLRCYPRGEYGDSGDPTAAIDRLIDLTLDGLGLSRHDVAPITVLGRHLSPLEIPSLYAAADCYVSPARGEGWGRPLMEAMASAIPVIATRWSAPLDFLTEENSLLLDVDGLELVDERMDIPVYRGQRWATPSSTHLCELLRHVVADPDHVASLGRRARSDVEARWQWQAVGRIAAGELARIAQHHDRPVRSAPRARPEDGPSIPDALVCTVVTRSHLPGARVLASSLASQRPGTRLQVLVVDGPDPGVGAGEGVGPSNGARSLDEDPLNLLGIDVLDLDPSQFARMALIYSPTELSCALKPWILTWALERAACAVYLDSDIRVYRPLDDAFALAGEHSLVLTPHVCHPLPRDGRTPDETALLASGMFNLGFVGVGPGSEEFLDFWKERLRDDGMIDQAAMRQADQRWVDFAPSCFAHNIWRDPAANVAYWNLHERHLDEDADGRPTVEGQPLSFFHFSGFDPRVATRLSRYEGRRPRVVLGENPALERLLGQYRAELFAAGFRRSAELEYGYARLPSGEVLTPERRRAYRASLLARDADPPRHEASVGGEDTLHQPAPATPRRSVSDPFPLVSLLIPTHNRVHYLEQALESAIGQSYEHLEIVVLDNASTDETPALAAAFAARDQRVRVATAASDLGTLENHRRGLSLSGGSLVKILHDDDRLLPHGVERLVEALEATPGCALSTSKRILIEADGTRREAQPAPLAESDGVFPGRLVGDLMLTNAINFVGEPTTVLFRRELLEAASYATYGGRSYDWLSDVSTWLRLLAQGSIAYVAEPLSETRMHPGQTGVSLGAVSEQAEWLDILPAARRHGYLAEPGAHARAIRSILPRLLGAAMMGVRTDPAHIAKLTQESLEELQRIEGNSGAPQ